MIRPSRLAGAVVVLLVGGAAFVGIDHGRGRSAEMTPSVVQPVRREAALAIPSSTTVRSTPTTTAPTTFATRLASDPMTVVHEGIEAWGLFAVTGDLSVVQPWFSLAGPQYELFEREARGNAGIALGGEPYAVTLQDETLTEAGDTAQVRGRVVFVRTGEPSQPFRWTIDLVWESERWLIWTVSETS